VAAYPELKFEIEGHTDSIGSEYFNQSLSEKRAATVRDYLVDAGVSINNVVARGFGKTRPIADNSSPTGRKLNRRVEMIVSGDVIGTKIGSDSDINGTQVIPPQPTPASVPLPR
jgi:outer membrane protein OmpA-like peptidoglycan-associated protein